MADIYGTLGPACASVDVLQQMFKLGMTGMRLNLSHVTLGDAKNQIAIFHRAAKLAGLKTKLLIDLQGPELRLGTVDEKELKSGDFISLPVPELVRDAVSCGQEMLLDDGKILCQVTDVTEGVQVRVLRGGLLKSHKSIALPGLTIDTPTLTEMDRKNLAVARSYGVTGVMLPFVRGKEDVLNLKEELKKNHAEDIRVFAKIENMVGVEKLPEIISCADEIVIARGDLGNAVPLWELPRLQKQIAAACRDAAKPFMVVTQMLASMEKSPVPTRAEVSDIYNAMCDGASSVMVTGETAVGAYPVEVIKYLANTVKSYGA